MTEAEEYEHIVKDLLAAQLVEQLGANNVTIRQNVHYVGKSGHNHQIDVAAEFRLAGVLFIVLVECKNYSHKAGVEEVMALASRVEDIGAHKGILVTTKGFQKGALKMAKSKGVGLVLAVDLRWNLCMESPIREILLGESFATKMRDVSNGNLSVQQIAALYRHSMEGSRHSPLPLGELARLQDDAQRSEEEAAVAGHPHFSFPTKGKPGYVFAHADLSVEDVVSEFSLDHTPVLGLDRDGLFSFLGFGLMSSNR